MAKATPKPTHRAKRAFWPIVPRRTIANAVEFSASLSDIAATELRQSARRIREAGHLSQSGRGTSAAAATAHDIVLLLIASGMAKTAGDSPVYAEALKALRFQGVLGAESQNSELELALRNRVTSPVEILSRLVDQSRMMRSGDQDPLQSLREIRTRRGPEGAVVEIRCGESRLRHSDKDRIYAYLFHSDQKLARKLWPQLFTDSEKYAQREFVMHTGTLSSIASFLGPLSDKTVK